jgi:hypothetical protein
MELGSAGRVQRHPGQAGFIFAASCRVVEQAGKVAETWRLARARQLCQSHAAETRARRRPRSTFSSTAKFETALAKALLHLHLEIAIRRRNRRPTLPSASKGRSVRFGETPEGITQSPRISRRYGWRTRCRRVGRLESATSVQKAAEARRPQAAIGLRSATRKNPRQLPFAFAV